MSGQLQRKAVRFYNGRPERGQLTTLLRYFGALGRQHSKDIPGSFKRWRAHRARTLKHASDGVLWELYERCERAYRQRIRRLHPDCGGNHCGAAELNACWRRAKLLFSRLGIER